MWLTREYQDVNKRIQILIDKNLILNNQIAGANIGVIDRNAVFMNINDNFDLLVTDWYETQKANQQWTKAKEGWNSGDKSKRASSKRGGGASSGPTRFTMYNGVKMNSSDEWKAKQTIKWFPKYKSDESARNKYFGRLNAERIKLFETRNGCTVANKQDFGIGGWL